MIRKIRFYKKLLIEIIETLCTICLFMYTESRKLHCHNEYTTHFRGHFDELKYYSEKLRKGEI